jgi:two-component system, OmpR family, response regulator MprA
MPTILVVDDDPRLCAMLRRTLRYAGFEVMIAAGGQEALDQVACAPEQPPALVVLDWMLPGLDGLEVVRRLRAAGAEMPILMLTARDMVEDLVEALDNGADDYLVKPFAPVELLARVRALLRRVEYTQTPRHLLFAGLRLSPVTGEAVRGGRTLDLTPTEFDLLQCLLRYPRQVVPKEQLLEQVWGYDFNGDDNVLEVYIGYLRRKSEAGGEPRLIQNVRGVGYILRE